MANELSRKGIAFGAAVALGSTLIAGGAANAAPNANYQDLELNVADYGDSNGVFAATSEDDLGLVLSWNGDVNTANLDDLSYNISWADADDEDGEGYGYWTTPYAYYDTYEDGVQVEAEDGDGISFDGWNAGLAGGTFTDTEDEGGIGYTGPVPAWDATESYDEDEDGLFSTWGASIILTPGYTPDVKQVVTVQAYIDSNGNNVIDGTETHSAAVDVTFYNKAALTPVLELDNDGVVYTTDGEDSIGYSVTFAEALNDVWTGDYQGYNNWGEDWYEDDNIWNSEDFFVESYVDGSSYDTDYIYPYYNEDVLYDEDTINYDVTDGVEDNGSSVTKVRAGMYNSATDDFSYTAWQTVSVVAPEVDYTENYVVEQDYVVEYGDGEDAVIRSDVESVEYVVEFWDEDTEDVLVSGVDATVYVQAWDYANDSNFEDDEEAQAWLEDYGVEVSGTEPELIEDGSGDFFWEWAVEGTSDANGAITLDITAANPDADLYLYVAGVDYEGSGDELGGDLYWDDTYLDVEFDSAIDDEDTYTAEVGGSFDFTAYVVDQWGKAPSDDVRIKFISEDRGGWDSKYFDVDADGSAEISLTDGDAEYGEETETNYYIDELQVKDGSAYESVDYSGDNNVFIDWLTDDAVTDYVTAAFTDEDGQAGIAHGDFFSGNDVFAGWDEDAYAAAMGWNGGGDGDYEWLEGYVHAENGAYIAGAVVTITGNGLMFDDYYGNRVAPNSITIQADEDGYYGVYVSAHKVGEYAVTVSSNGKSTTADLLIDDRNLYASAVAVSPFTGKAGTSENITATVTDRFGNLVPEADVTFSVTGGGYFVDDVATTGGEDEDNSLEDVVAGYGQASEMLVILSNEVGYGSTVTATIDVVDPLGVEEDTTASASLAAGATDFGKPAFWTKDLGDGTLKLYAKNIVGAGKITFFHNGKEIAWVKAADALDPKLRAANGSYYLVRTVKLVSGKNVLEIKDDGVRVVRRVASK